MFASSPIHFCVVANSLQMTRRRHLDLDAIRKSLLTECPGCRYMIPPAELSRPGQNWNLVRCPKCLHEFIVPQKATRMKTANARRDRSIGRFSNSFLAARRPRFLRERFLNQISAQY